MLTVRKANERFHTRAHWLDSWHSFSFGEHYDLRHLGFGPLRVINDDRIAGGGGFPMHPHRDMEIVTLVLSGALAHQDSLGTGSTIRPGDVQKMSAGSGIRHSEFNASATEPVHLLQIWIVPNKQGIPPAYEQIHFEPERLQNAFCLVAAPGAGKDIISLQQDACIYRAELAPDAAITHPLKPGRAGWLQIAIGSVEAGGVTLEEGDGLAIKDETALAVRALTPSTLVLFDLAG